MEIVRYLPIEYMIEIFPKHVDVNRIPKHTSWMLNQTLPVVQWLHQHKYLKISNKVIEIASCYNRVDILDWISKFYNIEQPSKEAFKGLGKEALIWWMNRRFKIYDVTLVDYASSVEVLEFWYRKGTRFRFTEEALLIASERSRKDILDWWLQNIPVSWYKLYGLDIKVMRTLYDDIVVMWWNNVFSLRSIE
jgi:hypothetical protein